MCEVSPKIQCPPCLASCTKGVVYCRCGFYLERTNTRWQTNKDRFDILSIPNYVIHKGVFRGRRCGTSDAQQLYHKAQEGTKEWIWIHIWKISIIRRIQGFPNKNWLDRRNVWPPRQNRSPRSKLYSYKGREDAIRTCLEIILEQLRQQRSNESTAWLCRSRQGKKRLPKEGVKECSNIHLSQQTRQRKNHSFSQTSDSYVKTDPQAGWKWYSSSPSSSSTWWQPSRQARGNTSPKFWHSWSWDER